MIKKYCVIIDSYPQNKEDQDLLLKNLKSLRDQEIDVLVTSHHPCSSEIIELATYFLFEKKNNYYFLDSSVLNENIESIKNPVYLKYYYLGDEVFRDRVVVTGWSSAITSQLMNSIRFLRGKKYDYAFYLVSDFICPDDFKQKLNEIIYRSNNFRNYFIQNSPRFGSWYAGFFFGFTIDDHLISKIPEGDLGENKIYQRYFPNCSGEDVILKIWGGENNLIENHGRLDEIFGPEKWNMVSSTIGGSSSLLHFSTSSSLYFDPGSKSLSLMLYVSDECPCEIVSFGIQILDEKEEIIFEKSIDLSRFCWFKEDVSRLMKDRKFLILKKYVRGKDEENIFFTDFIIINIENIEYYSFLKNFEKFKD